MKRYYLIDHKILFLFGYIFYLFTPYFVGVSDLFKGFPGMELYQSFFKKIPQDQLIAYAKITFLWLPSFYLGHVCFSFVRPYKRSLQLFADTVTSRGIPYVGVLLFFVLLVFAFISRNSLFGGYGSYDVGARGKMSTLLVLFNFFLAYQLITRQKVSYLIITGTIITILFLLSMGGRMYVMQTFVILLICKTSFAEKRFHWLQITGAILIAFFLVTFVGVWRMGASFNMYRSAYSLFAEPVFTWFSTSAYLISNQIPLFNFPRNFLTSFLNLVPNTFFNLRSYVVSTNSMALNYQNPLGADSVWSTIVINFGSAGSLCFLFVTGFMLNFLRHFSENNRFGAVYYILVCGMLPFQFFRDGFFLLHKQLYFNFLLLPGIILLLVKAFHYISTSPEALVLTKKVEI